jgi:small subunit ribosomal protein S21
MRKTNNNSSRGLIVEVKDGNVNLALRKFKRKVDDSRKLIDLLEKQFYEKPTSKRKRKKGAARARWLRKLREQQLPKKQY